jgi:nitrogen-specific signal transduction histidine kinase
LYHNISVWHRPERLLSGTKEILIGAIDLWRQPVEEKGLTLEVDVVEGWPEVRGDHERIAQVLTNLLSNAYMHDPSSSGMGSRDLSRSQIPTNTQSRLYSQLVIY